MFPARPAPNDNRYLDIVREGLEARDIEVVDWKKHISLQSGDIFHVHWPDLIDGIRKRPHQNWRGRMISGNFFATINRIRHAGGRIVWTVHNLGLHSNEMRSTFGADLLNRMIARTDGFLALTPSGIPEILTQYPAIPPSRIHVVQHPHYREVLPEPSASRQALRAQFGLPPGLPVVAMIGSLRENKGSIALLNAIADLPAGTASIIMAGSAESAVSARLVQRPDIIALPRRLTTTEVRNLHEVADLIVMPGPAYFNSGTIYMALSCDRPVLAADSPTQRYVSEMVGDRWLQLFEGTLGASDLQRAVADLPKPGEQCDLSSFAPQSCAQALHDAYLKVLEEAPR